ncbi:MAG: Streptopain precursor [Bacteroidetes bacterium ADurb.Bin408]|nr:MAG: Streptopain precursor [Bacteroidetes bacterium ADurb.Bin408]
MKHLFTSFIITIFLLTTLSKVFSEPVSLADVQKAAMNFLYGKADASLKDKLSLMLHKEVTDAVTKKTSLYIFDIKPQGFIILTADDDLVPVVGYSFDDNYSETANPVQNWFMELQLSLALKNKIEDKQNQAAWKALLTSKSEKPVKEVAPLCTTRWDQGQYYNYMCPVDSNGPGGHAYAGCVATAMGQVMKRWNNPITGVGGYAYQHIWPMYYNNYGVVEANFGATTYNWNNMPNQINNSNKIDVATLLFHCGVSVKMSYGPDGSGTHTEKVPFALKQYFRYHESAEFIERNFNPGARWDSLMKEQLDKGFPMVYSGSTLSEGHAWVVDGYQDSSYFHVNWGWSGWNNGYYYFSNLNSGNGDFTNLQGAVINIFPHDYVYAAPSKPSTDGISVYPNPALNYFNINGVDKNFRVDVINTNGLTLRSLENKRRVSLADLESGLYFVKITQSNMQKIIKLLVIGE